MKDITKKNMIKEYILQDKERFLLAIDIFENFDEIADEMLRSIIEKVVIYINQKRNLSLHVVDFGTMANYYYFKVNLTPKLHLTFNSHYYFKTYEALVLGAQQGYESKSEQHIKLRDLSKNYFTETKEGSWYIFGVSNQRHELNVEDGYKDLYGVFSQDDQIESLLVNSEKILGDIIVKVLKFVESSI